MWTILVALIVFFIGYMLNIFYITVFYHRGLTHNAVQLTRIGSKLVSYTGSWVTGIDPKGWACMHRLHHLYSDTPRDPHSPVQWGVFGVAWAQLRAYKRVLSGIIRNQQEFLDIVKDIPFNVSFLNRKKLWMLPYLLHLSIAILLGFLCHSGLVGVAYFLGIMSHPVQGWMVNSLAHKFGYRNFDIPDHSKNNWFVSLFVFGEGLQNNHHAYPESANFAKKGFEFDLGFLLCFVAARLGLVKLRSV